MKIRNSLAQVMALSLILLMAVPPAVFAQDQGGKPVFKQEELEQMLAPIALYPDSLLTQVLMASTYPLEVVEADRWAKKNKTMKGDALAKALEAQTWDPSVKSLVNFPQVLAMMSEKLDMTQKLGDAFLAQQKDVMDTIQKLRAKAQAAGSLKTTKEQVVKVEQQVIIIEPASPQVIYVPTYNPTVVYGVWAYPAYPPYPYYPPGYVAAGAAFSFAAGAAVGAAWGYAWGNANWHGGNVNVNYNQNVNINNNINRSKYASQYPAGQGQWKKQATTSQQVQARQAYRGYTGSAMTPNEQQQAQQKAQQAQKNQQGQQAQERAQQGQGQKAQQAQQGQGQKAQQGQGKLSGGQSGGKQGGSAFEGMDKGGGAARESSNRGQSSRESMSRGGGGGGERGGFGGGGGGGSRGGGGRSGGGGGGRR